MTTANVKYREKRPPRQAAARLSHHTEVFFKKSNHLFLSGIPRPGVGF